VPARWRRVSEVWRADHPWGAFYDFVIEHEQVARVGWWVAMGSDVRLLHAAAEEIGRLPDGATVLDVPCGGGVALRGLRAGQRVRYLAADISPAMLARTAGNAAARGVRGVHRLQTDVARLPLTDRSVDLCVSFTGLHCFPDPEAAVHELARVLRPGGKLLLMCTEDTFTGAWCSRLWHCRTYNRRELRSACEECGLSWQRELWFSPLHKRLRIGGIIIELRRA